jgi:hypothetical protein
MVEAEFEDTYENAYLFAMVLGVGSSFETNKLLLDVGGSSETRRVLAGADSSSETRRVLAGADSSSETKYSVKELLDDFGLFVQNEEAHDDSQIGLY